MIFGDPINFAILMKYIPQWSQNGSYKNGMFHFIIDSAIFPEVAGVATLGGDVGCVKSDNALFRPVDDFELFHMDAKSAFLLMLEGMLPARLGVEVDEGFVEDYRFQASTNNLEEFGCFVFAVGFKNEVRILGANLNCLSSEGDVITGLELIKVSEAIISKEKVLEMVAGVVKEYESAQDVW
ncbi:Imm42 family immunity protein [Pseudomonas sp. NPDC099000]|uniref:Imm42 family immunity protein n=1 Tax=Pseudomonas sp. NPDC099000 TaxID=3364488 RepID=UPI00383A25BA